MQTAVDDQRLKDALKMAFIEVLQERPDLIRGVLEETLEDVALIRAIQEGEKSEKVSREEVYAVLRSGSCRLSSAPVSCEI